MDKNEIMNHVDHTMLKPTAMWNDIVKLCEEAIKYKTASVCIPPCYVSRVKKEYGDKINICTVIGFPLGYSTTETKVAEAKNAINDGADEIDAVVNLCSVKNGDYKSVTDEMFLLKKAAGDKILKIIIETCYLTEEEKIMLCGCITETGVDYIKTSTGFGSKGAEIEDIRLFKKHIGKNVRMKAAGGVRTKEDMEMFINEGCERIGTSSAIKILEREEGGGY